MLSIFQDDVTRGLVPKRNILVDWVTKDIVINTIKKTFIKLFLLQLLTILMGYIHTTHKESFC